MIDTLKNQCSVPSIPCDLAVKLPALACKDVKESVQFHDGLKWSGWQWTDPNFGAIGVKQNQVGCFLWFERSLPKFMHGDNERVLSAAETVEAAEQLAAGVLGVYGPLFDASTDLIRSTLKVQRLDVCYQRKVPCSQDVFIAMARSLKTTKVVRHQWVLSPPLALHLTGVTFRQSMKELARWYDKGLESGNERYQDVVRHEEQLRGAKAQAVAGWQEGRFVVNQGNALASLNRRYVGIEQLQTFDLTTFLKENGTMGAAALGIVLQPEYEATLKLGLSESTYYRVKRLAVQARKSMVGLDLVVPADAWNQEMVL